jgi:hypothetical protein
MSEAKIVIPGVDNDNQEDLSLAPLGNPEDKPDLNADANAEKVTIGDKEYITNDNGDALNDDGTVFKTKDELIASTDDSDDDTDTTSKIEIDEDGVIISYTIDDNGNAVDTDGSIKYTKQQLDELEEDQSSDSTIDIEKVIEATKIVNYDKDGNPIKYENTEEGYQQYTLDTYNRGAQDAVGEYEQSLFGKYPVLTDVINYLAVNNTLEGFGNVIDYGKVKLEKDNTEQLKSIIYDARSKRGETKAKIDSYVEYIMSGDTSNDKLNSEAGDELKYLQDIQTAASTKLANDNKQAELDAIANNNKYWGISVDDKGNKQVLNVENSVYDIITKGKIKVDEETFTIPDKIRVVEDGKPKLYTKDDFFAYLREPIVVTIDGQRQMTTRDNYKLYLEESKRTTGNDVLDAFKRFVNYDTSQFIKEQVNKDKVEGIKRLKIKKKVSDASGSGTGSSSKAKIVAPGTR